MNAAGRSDAGVTIAYRPVWAEVDLAAVRANVQALREYLESVELRQATPAARDAICLASQPFVFTLRKQACSPGSRYRIP